MNVLVYSYISSVTASGMISIQTGGWLHGNICPRPIVAFFIAMVTHGARCLELASSGHGCMMHKAIYSFPSLGLLEATCMCTAQIKIATVLTITAIMGII
jgi:hypothetical protein